MDEQVQQVDVWAYNLDEEFIHIRELVELYPVISIDIKFPGIVARPLGPFKQQTDVTYQTMRCNVDLLRMVQLGLTMCNADGQLPQGSSTWQFNFKFSLNEDMYCPSLMEFLVESGFDFDKAQLDGIDVHDFGEHLMSSGIVLNDKVSLISFDSSYDFAYILKTLTFLPLPKNKQEFYQLVKIYFPCIYDVRHLVQNCKNIQSSCKKIISNLTTLKSKPTVQSGSNTLLILNAFFALKCQLSSNLVEQQVYSGVLYKLSPPNDPITT